MTCATAGRWQGRLLILAFAALLAASHVDRLRRPSLYSDDVQRVADLRARPLVALWARPFNEHLAPAFETVSWAAWRAAGCDLRRAPLAFTLASYAPFVLGLVLVGAWIRAETASEATALAAVAAFGLAPVAAEVAFWYSASSFAWALDATMVVLLCASRPSGGWGAAGMVVGAGLAPAFSGIGLLAGPIGALRILAGRRDGRPGWATMAPLAGSGAYLAVAAAFRYGEVVRAGLAGRSDALGGVVLALRAPAAALLPGIVGRHDAERCLPPAAQLALTGLGLAAALRWAFRSRDRGPIVVGLGLIAGGYGLTYPFRNAHGPRWLLGVERFHLFPLLGAVALLALAARPWLARLDGRPARARLAAVGLAGLLLVANRGRFEAAAGLYHFPEQAATLAAVEHLGRACRAEGVSKARCIATLPPTWSRWFQPAYNGLALLPGGVDGPAAPDPALAARLLGRLSLAERQALWGGMDASALLRPSGSAADAAAAGLLVATDHARSEAIPLGLGLRRYTMTGWPAYVEFELPAAGPDAPRRLCLPCGPSCEPLEVWWAPAGGAWSPLRSVRLRPTAGEGPRGWDLPLDRLPHWDAADAARIRVQFVAGPVAIGTPRLLR